MLGFSEEWVYASLCLRQVGSAAKVRFLTKSIRYACIFKGTYTITGWINVNDSKDNVWHRRMFDPKIINSNYTLIVPNVKVATLADAILRYPFCRPLKYSFRRLSSKRLLNAEETAANQPETMRVFYYAWEFIFCNNVHRSTYLSVSMARLLSLAVVAHIIQLNNSNKNRLWIISVEMGERCMSPAHGKKYKRLCVSERDR